jgi:hypothetical protein
MLMLEFNRACQRLMNPFTVIEPLGLPACLWWNEDRSMDRGTLQSSMYSGEQRHNAVEVVCSDESS